MPRADNLSEGWQASVAIWRVVPPLKTPRVKPGGQTTTAAPASEERDAGQLLQAQIRRLEEQFNRLRDQVRQTQQLASLGTAAAMMAHEFNNVLTPMVGYARFALDSNDPQLMSKALNMALKQASVAAAMSDRILGLAVNESQNFQPVVLKEVIEEAVASMCRDPAKDGITLTIKVPDDLTVLADDKLLRQVFFNLLLNAWQAIEHRNGRITIDAAPSDDEHIEVHVRDNGCGIAPKHIDSIFEAFFTTKGRTEDSPRKGCGLGLALCRDIISEHRGEISVESRVGEGTTFTITLPVGD